MTSHSSPTGGPMAQKPSTSPLVVLTPKEVAARLKVSDSWLAKSRMSGDGPPYFLAGRSIRYLESELVQWVRSQRRSSTSE